MPTMSRRGFLASSSTAAFAAGFAAAATPKPRADIAATASSGSLEVGVARRDVTPPLGIQMWGFSNPVQLADGVRDLLFCRVVVLKAGYTALGIVSLDMSCWLLRNLRLHYWFQQSQLSATDRSFLWRCSLVPLA